MLLPARAACDFRVQGRIGFVTVKGVVTVDVLRQFRAQVIEDFDSGKPPLVFLCDYRSAIWAMTVAELNAMVSESESATTVPAVMAVPAAAADLFQQHCWAMAQAGIIRKTVTSLQAAQAWCQQYLALEIRHRHPLGPQTGK